METWIGGVFFFARTYVSFQTSDFITTHFGGLFILGLLMETVSGVKLVLRRQTCGIYDIYSSGHVAHGTLIKRFFF